MSGSFPIAGGDRWLARIAKWRSRLGIAAAVYLTLTTLTGLSIWLLPFSVPNQVAVLVHTLVGMLLLPVCGWYLVKHFLEYYKNPTSHILVLGYFSTVSLLVCLVSGVVLTWQAAFAGKIGYGWDTAHILSTIAFLASGLVHVLLAASLIRVSAAAAGARRTGAAGYYAKRVLLWSAGVLVLTIGGGTLLLGPPKLQSELPENYSYVYGEDQPFAPSLAKTPGNAPIDTRVLAGSLSCGTSGCHEQITREWEPSAHRFAAMDTGFQKIQFNMAKLNGPESTRYCAGCHDPISLFSGTKNLYTDTEDLTGAHGYQEGVSCLACHGVRQVDVKGNANYLIAPPSRYLFEIEYQEAPNETAQFVRDFLIRAYPWQHVEELGKRVFKTPEYCAACHKQFIDKEINNLGWVQLQNQYDNWRQSRWNHPGDATRTIECRECHMPLVDSTDPSSGDSTDYNRTPNDGKHRSHRFVAANQMMPEMLKLPGWEEQVELTRQWLEGKFEIPEIADKWQSGPVVALEMESPAAVRPGDPVKLKMVLTSNKVGHDFPTGPLDIIQSWVQLSVTDDTGNVILRKGSVDERGFIEPGTFMFKAEPVDRYGNLIDRHNLWEMVGVRYRRSLFPGFSDTAEFDFNAPLGGTGTLHVEARLCYRKMDQYLVNFLFGEDAGLTSPITVMTTQTAKIQVDPGAAKNPAD